MGGSDKQRPDFKSSYYDDEGGSKRLLDKLKENPFVPAGILGGLGALVYSALNVTNKGNQKMSVYLIHTRVAVQGAIVTALTVGVAVQMYKEFILGEGLQGTKQKPK